jgi:hypothetical protein
VVHGILECIPSISRNKVLAILLPLVPIIVEERGAKCTAVLMRALDDVGQWYP